MLKKLDHKKNYHYLLLFVLFLHIILPILIFGHIGLIPQDTLEGVANDYIISKLYRFQFEYLDYLLGGDFKWFFWETIFYPINLFHLFLDIKAWYFFIYILKIFVAYISFSLLLKKLKFTKFQSSLGGILYVTILSALYQSVFDLAFMPYLFYLILKNKRLKTKNYFLLVFFGLNGGLVHNFFSVILIPFIAYFVFKIKSFKTSSVVLGVYFLALFISDIHLFRVFFSEIPFHRVDMLAKRPFGELFLESIKLPFFEFQLSGFHKIYRIFLIILFLVSIFLIIIKKNKIGLFLIFSVIIVCFLRTFVGSEFFYIFFQGPLLALQGLNFMRIDRVMPILMCLITMFALKNINEIKYQKVFIILIFISIFFQQVSVTAKKFHTSIRNNLKADNFIKLKHYKKEKDLNSIIKIISNKKNYRNDKYNLGNEIYSWDNYFHYKEYSIIKKIVGENRVMSVGIDPLVAVLNDMRVIDGYHNLYYASYKYKFRNIISKEIKKSDFLKGYYDGWGNRVYAFYNDKNNLQINFLEAKKIGALYVISGFEIKNSNLKLEKKIPSDIAFIHSTSWQCYLCLESDRAYYLYKIIN